jgi:translation elongation factor P/translation initiation factor 5A
MYDASDLRKGLKIQIDGQPWLITDFDFSKPGKGQAIYNCKLKNMLSGSTMSRSFRSNDRFEKPELIQKQVRFSYENVGSTSFKTRFRDLHQQKCVGRNVYFVDDMPVDALFFNNEVERGRVRTRGAQGHQVRCRRQGQHRRGRSPSGHRRRRLLASGPAVRKRGRDHSQRTRTGEYATAFAPNVAENEPTFVGSLSAAHL